MRGAAKRHEYDHKGRAWLAHTTAGLTRVASRKWPRLEDLIQSKRRKSASDLMGIAQRWMAHLDNVKRAKKS